MNTAVDKIERPLQFCLQSAFVHVGLLWQIQSGEFQLQQTSEMTGSKVIDCENAKTGLFHV